MFSRPQEHGSSSELEQRYTKDLNNLYLEVSELLSLVKQFKESLIDEYPDTALARFSNDFEKISSRFISYTRNRRSSHFSILHKSKERLRYANRLINSAKQTAKLFERLAKKPKSYSAVECRLKIDLVIGDLDSLLSYCSR